MRRGSCAYFGGGARSWSATGLYGKKTIRDSLELLVVPSNCTEINTMSHHRVLSQALHDQMQQSIYSYVSMTAGFLLNASNNMQLTIFNERQTPPGMPTSIIIVDNSVFGSDTTASRQCFTKIYEKGKTALTSQHVLKAICCHP